jgi:sorbitol-specific phosphotransferase system component IIA
MSFEATLENYLYAIDNVSGETAFLLEEIGHIDSRVQGESALVWDGSLSRAGRDGLRGQKTANPARRVRDEGNLS